MQHWELLDSSMPLCIYVAGIVYTVGMD